MCVLQVGEALFYFSLGQTLLQIGAASLIQIEGSVVTNGASYYKLGQPELQNRAAITNWDKMYYKLGHNTLLEVKYDIFRNEDQRTWQKHPN